MVQIWEENDYFWLFIIFVNLLTVMEIIKKIIYPHFLLPPIQSFFFLMIFFFFLVWHCQIMTKNMPFITFLPDKWVSNWITCRMQECLGRSHTTHGRMYPGMFVHCLVDSMADTITIVRTANTMCFACLNICKFSQQPYELLS